TAALTAISSAGATIALAGLACSSFLLESTSTLIPSIGDHPITRTAISALHVTECVTELLDDDCWGTLAGIALDKLAESESLLRQRASYIGVTLATMRATNPGSAL